MKAKLAEQKKFKDLGEVSLIKVKERAARHCETMGFNRLKSEFPYRLPREPEFGVCFPLSSSSFPPPLPLLSYSSSSVSSPPLVRVT